MSSEITQGQFVPVCLKMTQPAFQRVNDKTLGLPAEQMPQRLEWASLPCQMRFSKVFQQTLIDRLAQTTLELAACKSA